jgi:hypothetical protein
VNPGSIDLERVVSLLETYVPLDPSAVVVAVGPWSTPGACNDQLGL